MRIFTLYVLFFISAQYVEAQSDSTATKNGEIIDGEIVIEKEKKITLAKANKMFKKAELKSFDSEPLHLDFMVFQPSFDWPAYKAEVPFQGLYKQYPTAPYQNHVKVGFGNYASPLIDVGVSHSVEKVKLRASLFHESFARGPINDDFSRSSRSSFDFSAKYEKRKILIIPYLEIRNDQYNFYGNANRVITGFSQESPDEVRYNSLALGTFIRGRSKSLKYYLNVEGANNFQRLKESSDINKEPYFEFLGGISTKIDTSFSAGFDLDIHTSRYESGIFYSRSLFQISPWVGYEKNDFSLKTGFKVASNESSNRKTSGFYPFADLLLKVHPNWSLKGFVDGGFDWNSLDNLISQNQFLDDSLVIANTENKLKIGGGVLGSPVDHLRLGMEMSYSIINNLPFFVPSISDSARFILTYDPNNIEKINLVIDASYSPNNVSTYTAELEFANYTLNNLDKPWHLPTFQIRLNSVHNIKQKVIFSTNFVALSGIQSPLNNNLKSEKLKTIFDLGLGVKYLITSRLSLFFEADNLFNKEYERYIGYPVRGTSFKVGGKYRF
ncbi:MAG: hypothetical protein AB8B73_06905 [Ekhidna sp.]